jgi:GT2 family glycosyltransferase
MKTSLVDIIIVNWNGIGVLRTCLSSIERTKHPNFNVIVVDNGSTDNSVVMIRREFPDVKLIQNRENLGFSRANNQGIRLALRNRADYVLLLNNDIEIKEEDWLVRIVDLAEADPRIGIIGPRLIYPDGSIQVSAHMMRTNPFGRVRNVPPAAERTAVQVDGVVGAAFLIKRAVVDRIGLLDEGYSPFLYEESDYCMQAKRAGFKVLYYPSVTVVHRLGFSMSKIDQRRRLFVSFRNIARFRLINYPLPLIVPSMLALVLGAFVQREDVSRLGLSDLKRVRGASIRMFLVMRALTDNLLNLNDIVVSRIRNRALAREATS